MVALAPLLALPVVALVVLLAAPELDLVWEHHPSHFWLVLGTAAVNVVLAYVTNEAASRRTDARVILVSLAFLLSAGFLGLHALATPGVLLPSPNAGFVLATPVGLALAAVPAVLSVGPLGGPRASLVMRHARWLRRGTLALMAVWAAVSLLQLPPLNGPLPPEAAVGPLALLAVVAVGLYAIAAWRYLELYRRRRTWLSLAIVAALVLLAEAMLAVALSRNWHLSWWEWHVLMTAAFALIALGVRSEYRRTGSLAATFGSIYLDSTLAHVERWHARAIRELAAAEAAGRAPDDVLADLRDDGASSDELALLLNAAREIRRLDELFAPYLPQRVARTLRTDPGAGAIRGTERTVTVLFADLAGFTAFSETHRPAEVVAMLNEYWEAVVPIIERAGGSIEHFAGDAVLVVFNAVADQPDHAARAVRTAREMLAATDRIAARRPGWPRFHVGINTGPALVGTVGTTGRRSVATIGDTTNLGSRLMSVAEAGQIVIGERTFRHLEAAGGIGRARTFRLGALRLKGKRDPVEAWRIE